MASCLSDLSITGQPISRGYLLAGLALRLSDQLILPKGGTAQLQEGQEGVSTIHALYDSDRGPR